MASSPMRLGEDLISCSSVPRCCCFCRCEPLVVVCASVLRSKPLDVFHEEDGTRQHRFHRRRSCPVVGRERKQQTTSAVDHQWTASVGSSKHRVESSRDVLPRTHNSNQQQQRRQQHSIERLALIVAVALSSTLSVRGPYFFFKCGDGRKTISYKKKEKRLGCSIFGSGVRTTPFEVIFSGFELTIRSHTQSEEGNALVWGCAASANTLLSRDGVL